jgi:RNA polymerase sigma factor (sigma-70 family)
MDIENMESDILAKDVWPAIRRYPEGSFAGISSDLELQRMCVVIGRRRAVDALRRMMRRPEAEILDDGLTNVAAPTNSVVSGEDGDRFEYLLSLLDESKRAMVMDHFVLGYTYEEIAERHGKKIGTVCSEFYRLFKELRRAVSGEQ